MKLKNNKTGAVIETASFCSGGDWVVVDAPKKKTTTKKKESEKKKED